MAQPPMPAPSPSTASETRPRPKLHLQPPSSTTKRELHLRPTSYPRTSPPSSPPLITMTPTSFTPSTPSSNSTSGRPPRSRSPRPRSHPLPPPIPLSPRPQAQRHSRMEDTPPETPTRKPPPRQPSPRPRSYPLPPPLPLSPLSPRSPQRPSNLLAGSVGITGAKFRADNKIRTPPRSVPASYAQGFPSPSSSSPPVDNNPSLWPSLATPTRQITSRKHVSFPCPPSPPPLYTTDASTRWIPDMSLSPTAIASAFSASAFLVAWTVLVLDDSPSVSLTRGLEEMENGLGATAVMGLSEALGAIGKIVEGGWLASLWWNLGQKRSPSGKRRKAQSKGKRGAKKERPQVDVKGKMLREDEREGAGRSGGLGSQIEEKTQQPEQQTLKLSGKGERRARSSQRRAEDLAVGSQGKS
ncbi:hypothetical protein HDK64DRAFT_73151 [Phyllosticta capitalensis]